MVLELKYGESVEVGPEIDEIQGSLGNDRIDAGGVGNIDGDGGNDAIKVRAPDPNLTSSYIDGGNGNDAITVINPIGNTQIDGGRGADTIALSEVVKETENTVIEAGDDGKPDEIFLEPTVFFEQRLLRDIKVELGDDQDAVDFTTKSIRAFDVSTEPGETTVSVGKTDVIVEQTNPDVRVNPDDFRFRNPDSDLVFMAQLGESTSAYTGYGFDVVSIPEEYDPNAISVNGETVTVYPSSLDYRIRNAERLVFEDGELAFGDPSAKAHRLYEAAFDREPDQDGLRYWVDQLDEGEHTLETMAASMVESNEFEKKYSKDTSDSEFVDVIYQNVLDRDPDEAGENYWENQLAEGADRSELVRDFAESDENVQQVAPEIDDGIWLG